MASTSLLILAIACFVSLISPSISKTCSTQKILSTEKTPFKTCLDLPVLDSYLHYTYNASNSSLSVAFVAATSRSDGWIAWGINPTMTGMNGSQAFLAYRSGAGAAAPTVKTYNISSYMLNEGKLAFDFWDLRAESFSDNRIAIYTSVKIPAGADSVNQVWQIGGNVTNGRLGVHPMTPPNMNSKAVLKFTADSPAPAGGPGNKGSLTKNVNFGVNLLVLLLLGSIFFF